MTSDGTFTASSAKFLSIYYATDISGITTDGLLGLSPSFISSSSSGGELLITSLYNSGVIKKKMFGLFLGYTS